MGKIKVAELAKKVNMTEDVVIKKLKSMALDIKSGEDAKDLMKDVLKWMVNEKAPKLDKVTQTSEVTLDKVDGKWLISDMEEIDD